MKKSSLSKNKIANKLIFIGILLFIGLYFFSASLYPGGSRANPNTVGFDWTNNYWCNLMNAQAENGQLNPARPFAILAMLILCFSLMLFFVQFATHISKSKIWSQIIKIAGTISMVFAMLIFTKYHDIMTIISSIFGLFAVIGIMKEIYQSRLQLLKITGFICLLLLALNNYIYYSNHFIVALAIIQKISFVCVLLWILALNYKMYDILNDY